MQDIICSGHEGVMDDIHIIVVVNQNGHLGQVQLDAQDSINLLINASLIQ